MATRATTTRTTTEHVEPPERLTARSIPLDVDVPASVRAATDAVHRAEHRQREALAALRAAQRDLGDAPRADAHAAAAAEKAGEPIPARTEAVLREKVREAERAHTATTAAAKAVAREQDAAVEEVRDEWHERALADVRALLAEQEEILDRLDELDDRLAQAGAIVAALDHFPEWRALAITWPTPGHGAAQRRRAREQFTRTVRHSSATHGDLLAEYELLSRQALGKAARTTIRTYARASFSG